MAESVFSWNEEKNKLLKKERNITFEEIIIAIQNDSLIDIVPNPSKNHEGQMCFVVDINDYPYFVPFVESEQGVFLKTAYRSRKYKKNLLNK